jgi:hypothetical protein
MKPARGPQTMSFGSDFTFYCGLKPQEMTVYTNSPFSMAEQIDMQEVPILSFDFAAASKAHVAPQTQKEYIDDMQEVSILSFDWAAAAAAAPRTPKDSTSSPIRPIRPHGTEEPASNSCLPNSSLPARLIPVPSTPNFIAPESAASLCALLDPACPERNSVQPPEPTQESFDSQNTDNEDVHERDRKIAKCMEWWERELFIESVLLSVLNQHLLLEDWLNIDCYKSQQYELGIEKATNVAINFAYSVVWGREFKVGITADIRHRWERTDLDKFGDPIGYMHLGFRKMYIVHVSDIGKADLNIEQFAKDPEEEQQLISQDRSAGRMEIRMFTAFKHWPGFQNKGKGNEGATNKNGTMKVYVAVK